MCGGKNYHGEKTCSDFLHQNLGRRSEERKLLLEDTLPFPCAHRQTQLNTHSHTHTPSNTHQLKCTQSSTFLHPPPHSCFQTSAESCVPLSHLLSKVTIKDGECVYVSLCVSVFEGEVAASEKILIGKLYLGAPRDCAVTVNDLSEKCIPECTWGALAPGRLLNDL